MSFIEFTNSSGKRYLYDHASQWQVIDMDIDPACWVNHDQGRNMDCAETYEVVKRKLLGNESKERLERLAGLAMQGLCAHYGADTYINPAACIDIAQALIAELEKVQS